MSAALKQRTQGHGPNRAEPARADYNDEVTPAQEKTIDESVKHLELDKWKKVGNSGW